LVAGFWSIAPAQGTRGSEPGSDVSQVRQVRQPIARKAPISQRRSNTLMAIVFKIPKAPIRQATAEMTHDITRVTRI